MMANRPPNFVFLIGEDTGRGLGCYGDPVARCPNLDRLAARGCRYDQAYSTYPVCAPARASLVTGQHPMKIGTHQMRSTLLAPPRLFTHELRDAGYRVSWPTKTDFNFDPPDSFCDDTDDWRDALRTGALGDGPWLVFHNVHVTHESSMWPDPGEDGVTRPHNQFTGPAQTPRSPRITDPSSVTVPPYLPDTPTVRNDIARHYDNLAELDAEVGHILDALDASGAAGHTYVVFLADHGRGLPREKRWPYTAGLHMPLLIAGPDIEPGSVEDRLISWVDIAPTILSLAGIDVPDGYDGHAFLGPRDAGPREVVFAGRDRMDEAFDCVRIVRDHGHHYVRNDVPHIPYAQRNHYMENMPTMRQLREMNARGELNGEAAVFMAESKPAEELYDLKTDPHCVRNVADDPNYTQVKAKLSARLDAWRDQINDLGRVSESELIKRGLVRDRLDEYRKRFAPLPEGLEIGPAGYAVELVEAQALA